MVHTKMRIFLTEQQIILYKFNKIVKEDHVQFITEYLAQVGVVKEATQYILHAFLNFLSVVFQILISIALRIHMI